MKKAQPKDEFLRKRMERQRRIRKRRLIIFFSFFIVFLLCVGVALSLTIFFPIEKLNIVGSKIYSAEEIENISGINIGDNLFAINKASLLSKLKSKLPYIDGVDIERKLPSTLIIKVKDADEYASFELEDKYYIVSKSGWVLNESDTVNESLILIKGADVKCKIGTEMKIINSEQEEQIIEIADVLSKTGINTNYIDITDPISLTLGVEERFTVELGSPNNLEEKIKQLASMIKSIDSNKSGKINLSMWTSANKKGTFIAENAQ